MKENGIKSDMPAVIQRQCIKTKCLVIFVKVFDTDLQKHKKTKCLHFNIWGLNYSLAYLYFELYNTII